MTNLEVISRKEAASRGLTYYFTGKPCPHGHICERFVSSFTCVSCGKEVSKRKSKGIKRHYVTDDDLIETIKSCSSYGEFRSKKEYTIAIKRGFRNFAINFLGYGKTSRKWNKEYCIEEAKKFSIRSEFSKNSSGAYEVALKLGILKDCCAHMKRPICDADVCYIWGYREKENFICKAGITSSRLGLKRINYVSKVAGVVPDFLWYADNSAARDIEKKILALGSVFDINDVSGRTEFRVMSESDIQKVKEMTKWNNVAMNGFPQGKVE